MLQVVVAVSFSADNFIIARTLGAVNVPEYSIPQRMFALITMMSGMLVAPLWPAYSEAVSRGHMDWVRRTLGRSLLLVLALTSVASLILLLSAHQILNWWVGSRIHPSFLLLLGLALWTVMGCCGDVIGTFMNGVELLKFQVMVASIFGTGCIVMKVLFVRHFGITGVPWTTLTAYGLLNALPCAIYIPRFFAALNQGAAAVS